MAYVGGTLTKLFDEPARALTADAHVRMVEAGGHRLFVIAKENTPVHTGVLRAAWERGPVKVEMRDGDKAMSQEVRNDTSYAQDVEEGTGLYGPKKAPYVILPKKPGGVLHWIGKDGKSVFARRVLHPGSPGQHMLAIAANVTDAELHSGALTDAVLAEWADRVEGAADRQ